MKSIISKNAPAAIGPYVHATKVGKFIFTSGQIPVDTATGMIVEGIENQTKKSLDHIVSILAEEGYGLNDVIKATVFIADMNDFLAINNIYGQYFNQNKPARSCVQVARLPKDALIEIEVVAYKE